MVKQAASMTPLTNDYTLGRYDVICAKGRVAKGHSGNQFYRQLIQQVLPSYSDACSKFEKSMIVSEIIDEIRSRSRSNSCGVGFVKNISGMYYEVSDHYAREKVGQSLRDGLCGQYKSSSKAKKQRQKMVSAGVADDFDTLLKRNSFLTRQIKKLTTTAANSIEHTNYNDDNNNNNNKIHHQGKNNVLDNNDGEEDSNDDEIMDQLFSQTNLEILEAFKNNTDLVDKFAEVEYCHKKEYLEKEEIET